MTVAAENATKVYAQPDPEQPPTLVTSIPNSGIQPHGLWPSPDNTRMYVVNEHSDTVDVIDLTDNFKIVHTLQVGQEGQALIYVSNAVTSGNGTQNLGKQGLLGSVTNKLIGVGGSRANASALITIRPEVGLDMFQVIGRNLKLNATYEVRAACLECNGTKIPLLRFSASTQVRNEPGCGSAPQVLGFFRFSGVYDVDSLEAYEIP